MLDAKIRYLQIAYNYDLGLVQRTLPGLPHSDRILVEAGTPFIKNEGMRGVRAIRALWKGYIVADMKTVDGAVGEVNMARAAGANAVTMIGNSPPETLNLFVERCRELGVDSMVDMLGVKDPLDTLRHLTAPPNVVILHRGRDEENTRGKVIQYRHVNRIRSKFDVLISAAGGVDLKEARSAIFNGASIVVVNIVHPSDPWEGIPANKNVAEVAREFLAKIE
ncbi:MAG: orotidine 5'-phosphate decarboxylase [Anaerolineales bacterium]|nr:orotidine 5'-phosphate decarboxylase [Anaerolineales bacterium]